MSTVDASLKAWICRVQALPKLEYLETELSGKYNIKSLL